MVIIKAFYHLYAIIKNLFFKVVYGKKYSIGKNVTFRKGFSIVLEGEDSKLEIGDNCFFNNYCSINCLNHIEIGSGTIMGEGVKIYDHNHRFSNKSLPLKKQGYSLGEVTIGEKCWIGSNVTILKGASIGDGCIIGAGCVIDFKVDNNMLVKNNERYQIESVKFY